MQFCELSGLSADDLFAIDEGAALPSPRAIAVLRLIKSAGRAKLAPILKLLATEAREWRPVVGFPAYEVSDDGFVRRSTSSRKGAVRTLKAMLGAGDYLKVTLYRNGKPEPQRVHRVVCEAFHGPSPDDKPFACHRDGSKVNNRARNLYWGSATDNAADWQAVRRERIRNSVHPLYTPEWRRRIRALERMGYK